MQSLCMHSPFLVRSPLPWPFLFRFPHLLGSHSEIRLLPWLSMCFLCSLRLLGPPPTLLVLLLISFISPAVLVCSSFLSSALLFPLLSVPIPPHSFFYLLLSSFSRLFRSFSESGCLIFCVSHPVPSHIQLSMDWPHFFPSSCILVRQVPKFLLFPSTHFSF